jgi:molecular chaperone DnaJ
VLVHVGPHPLFGREGSNLTLPLPVTFPEAALGAEIRIPTPDGAPVTVRIPPGTSHGRRLRVRGRGMPTTGGGRGDLLVTVEIAVPQKLNSAARKALEEYAQHADADPRSHLTALLGE